MGNRLSDIYIYIDRWKNGYEGGDYYNIIPSKGICSVCKPFIKNSFEIKPGTKNPDWKNQIFNVLIYHNYGKPIFGYYPSYTHEMLTNVSVYYSVLKPDQPLVVSLTTKEPKTFNCYYDLLKSYKWDYSYYISWYAAHNSLSEQLVDVYKSKTHNRKITFKKGSNANNNVSHQEFKISSDGKFKRRVYTPNEKSQGKFELGDKALFDKQPNNGEERKNVFDTTCLTGNKIIDHHFDGIIVHYNEQDKVALLVEFIDKCNRIQFKRKDKYGYWWEETKVEYENVEDKLAAELQKIQGEDVIRYMLDKKQQYNNVTVSKDEKQQGYAICTHKPNKISPTASKFYLDCIEIKPVISFEKKVEKVEVYFIKRKDTKTKIPKDEEDTMPFLLAFTVNNGGDKPTSYYSRRVVEDPWKAITPLEKDSGFSESLKKIDKLGGCNDDFKIMRITAYEILTNKPPEPGKKAETAPPVPQLEIPEPIKPLLTLEQIIYIAVGCLIALILMTLGGYGLYWYYTTIWLLT